MKKGRRMALCGMMVALGMVIMLLGGVIPLATFCCPVLASMMLIPVMVDAGRRMAVAAYAAMAALSALMCPDKEAALLMLFLGYYPVLKTVLDKIRFRLPRIALKLTIFNLAVGAMFLVIVYILNLQEVMAEYEEMGKWGFIGLMLMANITLLLYDHLLDAYTAIYVRKIRPKLMHI